MAAVQRQQTWGPPTRGTACDVSKRPRLPSIGTTFVEVLTTNNSAENGPDLISGPRPERGTVDNCRSRFCRIIATTGVRLLGPPPRDTKQLVSQRLCLDAETQALGASEA